MKIGVIFYSRTGHTREVAIAIQERLEREGHHVVLEEVKAKEQKKRKDPVVLLSQPSIDTYDAVIFGSPVHGFSLSLEMKTYLSGLPSGNAKRAFGFATQGLGGGKRANRQIEAICSEKGLRIVETGVITWPRKSSKAAREEMVDRFSKGLGK